MKCHKLLPSSEFGKFYMELPILFAISSQRLSCCNVNQNSCRPTTAYLRLSWVDLLAHFLLLIDCDLWLAIRFKIMTSCTWAFLPRIIVYNRYVRAFIPYTTIYIAYIRVFNTRICAKSNARLYALLKTRIYAYRMRTCQSPRIRVQKCAYTRGSEIRLGIRWHEKCL